MNASPQPTPGQSNSPCSYKPAASPWTYEEAFSRNRGIISEADQRTLYHSRVAIAGMGGIGGIDLVTLARLGVGRFNIADPDVFEPANTNRQFGAMVSTMGRNKAEVMAEIVRDINPEADVRVFTDALGPDNVDDFLQDADFFVDAIEVFEMDVRRLLFQRGIAGHPRNYRRAGWFQRRVDCLRP